VLEATGTSVLQSGGFSAGQANTTVNVPICLPIGCFVLRVLDSGNNGITGGGYVLRDQNNRRIIDASLGTFGAVSQIGGASNRSFCLPISNISMLGVSCDATRFRNSPVYCNSQPGASSYQFWIYDAHGTYNRRVVTTAPNLIPSSLATNPVPVNVNLNIRARAAVAGVFGEFGPACRIRFIQNPALGGRSMEDGEFTEDVLEVVMPTLAIFPNPNRDGQVTVRLEGVEVLDGTPAVIEVLDMMGRTVRTEQAIAADGSLNHGMDLGADLNAGIYLVSIVIGEERYTQRLIKQ
jgi:hypothetical protein